MDILSFKYIRTIGHYYYADIPYITIKDVNTKAEQLAKDMALY